MIRFAQHDAEPPDTDGETLFRVLQGDGSWVSILETDDVGADRSGEWFEQIFAAPDAVPMSRSARHVFTIAIEVDPAVDLDAFHAWYDGTHVPVVATAGLLRGRRFRDLAHERRFLATYDMADRDVLESEELARVRGFDHFTGQVHGIVRHVLERAER